MSISGCTDDNDNEEAAHRPTMTNIPSDMAKVWTVSKAITYLRIACNNVLVLDWTVPEKPPDTDECEKLSHTSWKTWFLKDSSWDTGTMKYLTAGADYMITATSTVTKAGANATISCRVFFPAGSASVYDTVGENPSWALQPNDQLVVDPTTNTTTTPASYDSDTHTSSIKLVPAPSFDTNWRCDFSVSKAGGAATKISATATIKIVTMVMNPAWILADTDLIVVCVVNDATVTLSDITFTWGADSYTSATATAAGLTMKVGIVI